MKRVNQTHYLSNKISKTRVAQQQPTAGSNTVGLVLELLRVHFSEVFEPVKESELIGFPTYFFEPFLLKILTHS